MRSSSGICVARELRASITTLALLLGAPAFAEPIDYDAILYRARAGFSFCYSFAGTAGWSLRAIAGGRITHTASSACPRVGLTPSQLAATLDCAPECHADCASFVRRAWAAGASQALTPLEAPLGGNCADPSSYGGDRFVRADAAPLVIAEALAAARPGDWCSHADHVLMLVARASPRSDRWLTWEANSSAVGIGQGSVELGVSWLRSIPRDDCRWTAGFTDRAGAWKNSGCWHPPAARTGPPLEVGTYVGGSALGDDGVLTVDDLATAELRFARPAGFPALGDYLVWFRWRAGGSDDAPIYAHRLVRVPAFSRRADPATRLARFPEGPADGLPRDVDDGRLVVVALADLMTAPAATPTQFKAADGAIGDTWTLGVGMAPVPPARFTAVGVPLAAGTSVAWRVRVERYGELSGDGATRRQVVMPCEVDAHGREQVEYCKDPRWSPEQRLTIVCGADDGCRVGAGASQTCGPAPERPEDAWTSGCAALAVMATGVHAGDTVAIDVTTASGLCAGASLWVAPSDWATRGAERFEASAESVGVYDFCADGPEQPVRIAGPHTIVPLGDDWTGRVLFHIPSVLTDVGCIDYVGPEHGGECCPYGASCQPQGMFRGPLAAVGGGGGTHGWTTVRMFDVAPARIPPDASAP